MANEKTITIKLVKSAHGRKPNQANQTVTKPDNDAIRGMVATAAHLVEVVVE